ncbi:hypothetical protein [Sorangium sp. So ce854]|uniref:hypothetical protein n=1 Tax=Sorangium sp. So ce854 TaxID=3133322 RepID=UPI003F5F7EFF
MWKLQTGTALAETDDNFVFCVRYAHNHRPGSFPDIAFFVRDSGFNTTEFHILSGNDQYQSYLLQTKLPWQGPSDATYELLWNGDGNRVYRVNKTTGVVEVADNNRVIQRVSIPFGPNVLHPRFRFVLTTSGIIAVDPQGPSGQTEVYVTDFTSTGAGVGFTVPVRHVTLWGPSDDTIDFVDSGAGNRGIGLYNRGMTSSNRTEYSVVNQTFQRYLGRPDRPTELNAPVPTNHQIMRHGGDMCVVIKNGTGTGTTEVHIAANPT